MAGRGLAPTNPKHFGFFLVAGRDEVIALDSILPFFVNCKQLDEGRVIELWNLPSVNPAKQKVLPFLAFSKFVQQAEVLTYRELIAPSDPLLLIKEELEKLGPKQTEVRVGAFVLT